MSLDLSPLAPKPKRDAGFTLLELLIVVSLVGILSAIAIQNVSLYRARSIDASMRSDLRNAAIAMESYYGEFFSYPTSTSALLLIGYRNTSGVTLTINVTSPSTYLLTAVRPAGTQSRFRFDSATGLIY